MKPGTKWWFAAAVVFGLVNLGGGVYAVVLGEANHAGVHALLTALSVYVIWRLPRRAGQPDATDIPLVDRRLDELQQSVDAVAIEVERIGEAQRYHAKVAAERAKPTPKA